MRFGPETSSYVVVVDETSPGYSTPICFWGCFFLWALLIFYIPKCCLLARLARAVMLTEIKRRGEEMLHCCLHLFCTFLALHPFLNWFTSKLQTTNETLLSSAAYTPTWDDGNELIRIWRPEHNNSETNETATQRGHDQGSVMTSLEGFHSIWMKNNPSEMKPSYRAELTLGPLSFQVWNECKPSIHSALYNGSISVLTCSCDLAVSQIPPPQYESWVPAQPAFGSQSCLNGLFP